MTHPVSEEALDDFVYERLESGSRSDVERHLHGCADCAAKVGALRALRARVALVPRAIEPPSDLWPELRAELRLRSERRSGLARQRWLLAAAAVLLIALSSTITTLVLRRNGPLEMADSRATARVDGPPPAAAAALADFRVLEAEYARAAAELLGSLDTQRGSLPPRTVEQLEASLRIIDQAIQEARAALVSDPGNHRLVEMLSTTYERKLDLLKRGTNLSTQS